MTVLNAFEFIGNVKSTIKIKFLFYKITAAIQKSIRIQILKLFFVLKVFCIDPFYTFKNECMLIRLSIKIINTKDIYNKKKMYYTFIYTQT